MNQRLVTVLLFAVGVAALASFVVYRLVASQLHPQQQQQAVLPTSTVVVATHDLEVGALIKEADVREVAWTNGKPDHSLEHAKDAIGRGAIATIYQNEPIVDTRLAAVGAGAGLAATIPLGKRAVAMRVNDVVGLAGFVMPGMRVDVLISGTAPMGQTSEGTLSRTVLQNIEVLSAGQRIDKNVDGKPEEVQVVNLLVTPEQAETLSLASSETKVQLVLRNPLDTKDEDTRGTSVANLFGRGAGPQSYRVAAPSQVVSRPRAQKSPVAAAPNLAAAVPMPPPAIEVFNGARRSIVQETH